MPLLGLFSRRNISSSSSPDSLDGDYVLPDKSIYNLNSNSKLKLPFRRRHVLPTSDPGHDLSPPPPVPAPHNHSARSLPPAPSTDAPKPPKKSPPLFPWARERTRSKPPPPPPPMPPPDDSFNLKAFRHVRPDPPPEHSADSLLPPPRPRTRGDSVASDSSQRISVAAFREAQARSRANSPVPSFRPTSTADTVRVDAGRQRSSTLSVLSASDRPQPNRIPVSRSDPSASDSSSSASSDSDDDQDVDSDGQPVPNQTRKRTLTRRVPIPAPSSPSPPSDPPSHIQQQQLSAPPLHPSDQLPSTRQRASVSTSALIPNAAARSASALATTTPSHVLPRLSSRKQKDDSNHATDDSDSCEDMPLADLVAPRRPGSSASNYPRMPQKPLIDINTLAGGPPLLTPILRHEHSLKNTKGKEPDIEKDQPFSIPAALAVASPPISPSASASPASNHRLSADVPLSSKPKAPDNDDDLVNAIRLVGALDKEHQQPSETVPALKPHPSDRIVPTPIRAREPPTSFSVLSRPAQRQSTTETSPSLSPASQTRFSISSPPPDIGARQRASTMINSPTHKDKSDATSIVSTSQSTTSRSSSRIPPVPLIHSIPDSPSVTGRPRPESRTSVIIAPQSRSQPHPKTPNKILSQELPQRPFPSNSSLAGESPAGSSTGDSSSGRAPFTPRDGSDLGIRSKGDTSDVDSTLKARGHAKKSSVTFEDQPIRERVKMDLTNEQRTRDRRRSEAKAALEFGKIVNGRGRLGNDSDEDVGVHGRNPAVNVTMENSSHGMMQPGWPTWQQQMPTGMGPMVPPQFNNDPAFFAAHQRALLMAKQAYQMAVAQHAMQMAGEEWERSSNVGFASGGSVYGGGSGGSVYGGGSGGSVYGGGSSGSVYGGMGMMGMPSIGMLMPPNPWASRSSIAFPSSGSVYGGMSSSLSDYGGGGGGGGWGTRSVYGDSFGPSASARPGGGPTTNSSASAYGGGSRPRAQTGILAPSSSSRPSGVPKRQAQAAQRGQAAPPSSWKSGR